MRALETRLQALERRAAASAFPSGLGHFYALAVAMEPVGGADALLARLDAGAATDEDREAIAAAPGGIEAIRRHAAGLQLFYGGVLEYESPEHLESAVAEARAAGYHGTVIALPSNGRGNP